MLRSKQILISALALGAGAFNLVACGQTGSLYLPTRAAPVKQAANTESTQSAPQAKPVPAELTVTQ